MVDSDKKIVLVLESAIDGGSVALFQNGYVINSDSGGRGVSKSEGLIIIVENLLKRKNLSKSLIGAVVVSNEPGSITGSRIGLAAAQGIADALGVEMLCVSLLECMLMQDVSLQSGKCIAAFFTEKKGIYCRMFTVEENKIISINGLKRFLVIDEFLNDISLAETVGLYFNSKLIDDLNQSDGYKNLDMLCSIIEIKGCPATIIGNAFIKGN